MLYISAVIICLVYVVGCIAAHQSQPRNTSQCLQGVVDAALDTCQTLLSILPDQVFFQNNSYYSLETTALWSQETIKSPSCVFSPENTENLATGLKIIVDHGTNFVVRSGGHMPVPGHNSINGGGIMIATTHFTEKTLVDTPNQFNTTYVRSGSAFRWIELYEFLARKGLFCIGGRVSSVGSSLLLGGGLSFFSGTRGWAANNVVNYEVVLANSTIIQVNNQSAPDLFWALKGGSNNFGIVTRYDLMTFESQPVFGGTVNWAPEYTQTYLDAQTAFILPGGGSRDPNAAIMTNFGYVPQTKQNTSGTTLFYNAPKPNPEALRNFTAIPYYSGSLKVDNLVNIVNSTSGFSPRTNRWTWGNIAMSASVDTMDTIFKTVVENSDRILSQVNCTVGAATQPVTQNHIRVAREMGGDALDLDPERGTFVIALIYGEWDDATGDATIHEFINSTLKALEIAARAKDIFYPFIFLNDAGCDQDPISTYGYETSAEKMREIARKFDPYRLFQRKVPGYKLSGEIHAC